MATTLTFQRSHDYTARRDSGITVPVTLTAGGSSVRLHAKLDTGASVCIFERAYGEQLGLKVEDGRPIQVRTANSEFQVYGHDVTIACFDWQFDSFVFFAATTEIQRNALGRQGWLHQFRVGLIEYDSVLYLSRYNQE
ncbi:MAG TPA: aspartyl protease family protein [Terriglobia bacterium]|nr:aspartyl protease family protein [Terriglobia bacterium]